MTKKAHQDKNNAGFTLVELSIVLVIIGLIVGGIFVGQDLIAAAQLRATIAQVDRYNAAVNTFRVKFNGIPGDFLQSYASAFSIFTLTTALGPGEGDGNGLIEGGASAATNPSGETLVFWRHLSDANLVDGLFGINGNATIVPSTGLVTATVTDTKTSTPATKLTPTQNYVVFASLGLNYFQIVPLASITNTPSYTYGNKGVTPVQAYSIDSKMDDGMPNGGFINAKGITTINGVASWAATSAASTCITGGANATDVAATYNRNLSTGGNDGSCSLRFRFN